MTLTEFLLARIAEDEAAAREADADRLWRVSQEGHRVIDDAGFMQRFTPDRVLAECEAKRAIVARSLDLIASFGDWDAPGAIAAGGRCWWDDVSRRERSHAHATLATLATLYADHPDHDEMLREDSSADGA